MADIVNINFESGNLSTEFTSYSTTGGDLTIASAAGMAGTNLGLSVLVDDANVDRGRKDCADASGIIRTRLYFDPNGFSADDYSHLTLFQFMNAAGNEIGSIRWQKYSGVHHIFGRAIKDAGTQDSADYIISDTPHYIELLITKASAPGANDGIMTLWIDGVQIYTITTIDNDTVYSSLLYVLIGACDTQPTNPIGTVYLDQLVVRNDNTEIGPCFNPSDGCAVYGYNGNEINNDESSIPWPTWDNGAAGAPTIIGDTNWGKLEVLSADEARSQVIDLGDANPRTYTISENAFTGSAGQSSATLQIRGDTNPFVQDGGEPPNWADYTIPTLQSWRYVQIRIIGATFL